MTNSTPAWSRSPEASDTAIEALLAKSQWPLPDDYISYLRSSNGGEGEINVQPCYCQIWPAEDVFTFHSEFQVPEYAPGFLAFGSSGGGELIAFDMRESGRCPVVSLPCIGLSPAEAAPVAVSFADLTTHFGIPYTDSEPG